MQSIKPLNKFWNRSPFFYKMRFKLLLREIDLNQLEYLDYNKDNKAKNIPKLYFEVNKKIFQDRATFKTDFDKVIHMATWLRNHISGGKGLGISSDLALEHMLAGGYGICSDFCQIFNNFCLINNIRVREWGLNNKTFDGDGHSYNEFYCKDLKQWIFIDVSNSIVFKDESKTVEKYLSVYEVFYYSKFGIEKKLFNFNPEYSPKQHIIDRYYFTKNIQPFLIDNYNNKFYDTILKKLDFLPIPFIHGFAILLNKSYKYKYVTLKET